MLLVGDIGGTNTRLALFEYSTPLKQVSELRFLSCHYSSLMEAIKKFLSEEKNVKIKAASFGIAGPVRDGRCQTTNIPWVVDVKEISKELNIPSVYLLNDLEANAYGIQILKEDEFYTINKGDDNATGNSALLAAGTGLGEAGLYFDGKKHRPFACEGGHTDFAPRNELEIELLRYLIKKFGHVSFERILSGSGIYDLYRFLVDVKKEKVDENFDREIKTHDEPQIMITKKGMSGEIEICSKVLDWFISFYGAEAGNVALKFFALGGVYLGGGIAPIILEKLKQNTFLKAFTDKGRFASLMKSMPVKVILNDKAALLGAAHYGLINKK